MITRRLSKRIWPKITLPFMTWNANLTITALSLIQNDHRESGIRDGRVNRRGPFSAQQAITHTEVNREQTTAQ